MRSLMAAIIGVGDYLVRPSIGPYSTREGCERGERTGEHAGMRPGFTRGGGPAAGGPRPGARVSAHAICRVVEACRAAGEAACGSRHGTSFIPERTEQSAA